MRLIDDLRLDAILIIGDPSDAASAAWGGGRKIILLQGTRFVKRSAWISYYTKAFLHPSLPRIKKPAAQHCRHLSSTV